MKKLFIILSLFVAFEINAQSNIHITSNGQLVPVSNTSAIISPEGGANYGKGRDIYGKLYNTTALSTTSGTIGSTSAVLGGVISPTNAVSSSVGIIYSTDNTFGTYSSTTLQSNVVAGTYAGSISGLASSTLYYAKAFVTNSAGTNYGNVVNFTTAAPPSSISNGLVLNIDASNTSSYSGSGTTWTDLSGNNNHITLAGGYSYNSFGSIIFNGTTGWGYNNADILSKTVYTKQAWVKFNSFSVSNNIISGGVGMHAFWLAGSNPGHLQGGHNGAWSTVVDNTNLSTGTWYNLAVTFSNSTGWVLYINGQQKITSTDVSMFTGTGNIQIASFGGAANFFSGEIAQALVYNRALTSAEILQNFNDTKTRFGL